MEMKLIKSGNAIGESNFHIQLTPAFRQDIFQDKEIAELTLAYILEKLQKLKIIVLGYGFGSDHPHLFVSNVRFVGEAELVRQIKGYSSYMMRKHFLYLFKAKLWGDKFWSGGHFYRNVGSVNAETMKHYIEDCQDKHWQKVSIENVKPILQKKIEDF